MRFVMGKPVNSQRCSSEVFIREDTHKGYRCRRKTRHLGVHSSGNVSWTDEFLEWDIERNDYRSTVNV